WEFHDVPRRRQMYRATVEAAEALKALDGKAGARLWYNEAAPLGLLYQSIAFTRIWGYRLLGSRFPSLWNPITRQGAGVEPGEDLVVIAADRTAFAEAVAALNARGLGATIAASRDITADDIRFVLLLLRTEIDPRLLEDAPLGVSARTFLDGSTMAAADRVTIDADRDLFEVTTNRSTYDWQVLLRPMMVSPGRRYLVAFQ